MNREQKLERALRSLPRRKEKISGQTFSYLKLDDVLAVLAALSHEGEAKVQGAGETWNLLNDVRKFIEDQYTDPATEPDGEWLAKEARPIHDRVCRVLANLPSDAALSTPKAEAVEPVAWLLDWGFKKGPGVSFAGGGRSLHDNLEAVERHERKLSDYDGTEWIRRKPLYTSPAPTITDEAVERIEEYYSRQIEWSRETFGPALRTGGVIDHIRKELKEIEADPLDLSEWVDVIILAMDGFWRHGGTATDLMPRLLAKQQKNMARTWPDWRTMSEDRAIEHDRSGEADDEAVERAVEALTDALANFEPEDGGPTYQEHAVRAALLAAFPSRGEGE